MIDSILLKTKLMVPSLRPNMIERARFMPQKEISGEYPLTLIVAPAGFGKSTLANQWVQTQANSSVAWFTVDNDDNDPLQFFRYVIAALQSIDSAIGNSALDLLQSRESRPFKLVVSSLVNDLVRYVQQITLVIDDYHEIGTSAVHEAVAYLIEHQPANFHLVITSRMDPPLSLARLRARGQLLEIRAADLRFSNDEVASFFATMGLDLSAKDIAQLETRTEGWIAGLQMAAISLQGRDESAVHRFITAFSGSNRHIVDYLFDEVLQRQSEEIQSFLCNTSFLDRLSASLCNAVTGRTDSDAILAFLDQASLFVISLDSEREWYRYHRLFADVLRYRLQKSDPEAIAVLHRRASEWYQQHELTSESIMHTMAAGDPARAAKLVETAAQDLWTRRDMISVRSWLRALPEEAILSSASLTLLSAQIMYFQGRLPDVERLVKQADQLLSKDPTPDPILLGELATLGAMFEIFAIDTEEGLRRCQWAVETLPASHPLQATAHLNLGIGRWLLGQLEDAMAAFKAAQQACLEIGNRYQAQVSLAYQGEIRKLQGRLNEAERLYQSGFELTPERLELPDVNGLYIGLGAILYERNDLEIANENLKRGLELGMQEENVLVIIAGLIYQAYLEHALRNDSHSAEMLAQAVRYAEEHQTRWLWSVPSIHASWTRLALLHGDLTEASQWADSFALEPAGTHILRFEAKQIALARVLIARDEVDEAARLITAVLESSRTSGRRLHQMQALALRALIQKNQELAFRALEEAMEMAEPEGFVRLFVDEGNAMRTRLERYVNSHPQSRLRPYAQNLLRAFAGLYGAATPETQNLQEPLSEREMEVLALMASGLSNAEIANRLYLSVTTVKKHGTNIFGKLEVNGRQEAVNRARDLRLIR